jgi:hypothetical protein
MRATCCHALTKERRLFAKGIPLHKSFKKDILREYLQNAPFVFIDLARKRRFWVYIHHYRVNMLPSSLSMSKYASKVLARHAWASQSTAINGC